MAIAPQTIAGTKVFISEKPIRPRGEVTLEDFQGVNWIYMDGLFNLGELGAEPTVNTVELINSDWVVKSRGTKDGGTMSNQFVPIHLDPGQRKFLEASKDKCNNYGFRIERGADCSPEQVVTIASGGVVTWVGSQFQEGQPIVFSTDGVMPEGLEAGVAYYVVAEGLTDDSFRVALTPGGEPISTTGSGTGEIIATAPPAGMTDMFIGLALDGVRSGGGRNDNFLRTYGVAVSGEIFTI